MKKDKKINTNKKTVA